MSEQIAGWFVQNLGGTFSPEAIVFIVSLFPILELRGGIIAGFLLGLDLVPSFLIAFIGNIIPIPFILVFIKYIFKLMKKTRLRGMVEYAYWGLLLFVGIPLPGTGAWTGSLIAALLNMDVKKSFGVIAVGVIVAGVIISIFSYGLLGIVM